MINRVKNNRLMTQRRRDRVKNRENSLGNIRNKLREDHVKASPERLLEVRREMLAQKRKDTQRKLILLAVLLALIVTGIVLLFSLSVPTP